MRFAIYDASSGGNLVWPTWALHDYEKHDEVSVSNGLFNVLLGSQEQPLSADHFDSSDRYLQIWVCQTAGAGCTSTVAPPR